MLILLHGKGEPFLLNTELADIIRPYTNPYTIEKDAERFKKYEGFNTVIHFGDDCIYADETFEMVVRLSAGARAAPVTDPFAPETKEVIKGIRENFQRYLAVKTGWGRNEVLKAFNDSVPDCLK